jgi:hypothetical protein
VPVWEPLVEATKLADGAVQTRVLADAAVDTAKIADLAVTNAEIANATITKLKIGDQEVDIQRMLDPIDWDRAYGFDQDVTTDTTWRHHVDETIEVPAWAGEALIIAQGSIQVTGTTGQSQIGGALKIDDTATPTGAWTQTVPVGEVDTVNPFLSVVVTSPGSTIETRLWGRVTSGTSPQNSNIWTLNVAALFKR